MRTKSKLIEPATREDVVYLLSTMGLTLSMINRVIRSRKLTEMLQDVQSRRS